jgi:hypothetical protein
LQPATVTKNACFGKFTVAFLNTNGYNLRNSSEGTAATFHAAMATTTALARQQHHPAHMQHWL